MHLPVLVCEQQVNTFLRRTNEIIEFFVSSCSHEYIFRASSVHNPGLEWLRAVIFIALGLFGVFLPIPHGIYLYGFDFMWPIIWRLAIMGITYISGALIYVFKAPERYRPGKFDFHLNSHVIWHLFVLTAALIHYQNHFFIYTYQMQNNDRCLSQ